MLWFVSHLGNSAWAKLGKRVSLCCGLFAKNPEYVELVEILILPLKSCFLMVGNSWGYSQDRAGDLQHPPSPFLALSTGGVEPPLPHSGGDVCILISNCHFPCRKVLESFMAMILMNVCGSCSRNIWQWIFLLGLCCCPTECCAGEMLPQFALKVKHLCSL